MSKLYFSPWPTTSTPSIFASVTDINAAGLVPILPSYSTALDAEARVNTVMFGNGYQQDAPDGINTVRKNFAVTFEFRRKRIIEELNAFFSGGITTTGAFQYDRDPSEYFFFVPPSPFDQLTKVKCLKWHIEWKSADVGSLSALFTQTFEI